MSPLPAVTLELPVAASSVSAGRRFVAAHLDNWGRPQVRDTAVLLTSEVVTNAVLHAGTPVRVTIRPAGSDGVTVAVTDGSRRAPKRRHFADDATTGRGIALVEMLASSWEVTVHDTGKTVTFTVHPEPGRP